MTETDLTVFLPAYARAHPAARPVDFVKLLFQGAFGGEHLVADPAGTLDRLVAEADTLTPAQQVQPYFEPLPGEYCRMNLSALKEVSPALLNRIFVVSSREKTPGAEQKFEEGLVALQSLCKEHRSAFGFSEVELAAYLTEYRAGGLRPVSHSEAYRAAYGPAYRVVHRAYAQLFAAYAAMEKLMGEKEQVSVAIDGPCGSGKTRTAGWLEKIFDCNVFHADDFFLRPEQRTPERLSTPGGNMDRERLAEEICRPVREGKPFAYRKFDCQVMALGETVQVQPKKLAIFEGSYCMHPDLREYYDLSVFVHVSLRERLRRLRERETPESMERFLTRWIPMEDAYFETMQVEKACTIKINTEE